MNSIAQWRAIAVTQGFGRPRFQDFVALIAAAGLVGWHFIGERGEVLKPDGGPVGGFRRRPRLATSEILDSFAHDDGLRRVKGGVPSMRFETHDRASMLFRHVDIDLAAYPMLAWRWYIELPIRSPLDERTREGDDHPARLFLRFGTDHGEKRAMEVIWGNRLIPGEYKYIGGFPHFVADAGEERVGRWLDEKIDLARVYGEIWKDAAPAHLVDIAVFCDSDDTHTASISYFDYVRLERR